MHREALSRLSYPMARTSPKPYGQKRGPLPAHFPISNRNPPRILPGPVRKGVKTSKKGSYPLTRTGPKPYGQKRGYRPVHFPILKSLSPRILTEGPKNGQNPEIHIKLGQPADEQNRAESHMPKKEPGPEHYPYPMPGLFFEAPWFCQYLSHFAVR